MKAVISSEMSISFHQATRSHVPEDITHYHHCYLQQYDYSYDYQDPEDPTQEVKPTDQETPSTSSASTPSVSDTSTEETSTPSTAVLSDSTKTTVTTDEPASTTTAVETEYDKKTTPHTKSPGLQNENSDGGDKQQQQQAVSLIAMLLPQQGTGRRRCSPGFFRDSRGRCRRHRKPGYLALQTLPLDLP
jgi:hypothetical protein